MAILDEEVYIHHAPFTHEFCAYDARWFPWLGRRMLVFSSDAGGQVIIKTIKDGMRLLVQHIPALAGSVSPPVFMGPNGQPGWRRLGPGQGLRLVIKDLSDEIDFASLEVENFPPAKINDDLVMPMPFDYSKEPHPVGDFQLSLIDGGALLSICTSHSLTDGNGDTTIIGLLAKFCRQAQSLELVIGMPVVNFDNRYLIGLQSPKNRPEDHPICTPIAPIPGRDADASPPLDDLPMAIRIYRISENKLAMLKTSATRNRISTNDALYALIWRLIIRVRVEAGILPKDQPDLTVHIVVTIDMRKHLGLASYHIGNVAYLSVARLPIGVLLGPNGLVEAAAQVRAAINAADRDSIAGFLQLVESLPILGNPENRIFQRNGDVVVSPMTELRTGESLMRDDWGPAFGGKAVRFRCAHRGFFAGRSGAQFVMPLMPDEQGAEMMFQLDERGFDELERDSLFVQYLKDESS